MNRQGIPVPDPLVKVYDVRSLRPLAPISFPAGPAFAKFHPRNSSTILAASMLGQFQVTDVANPGAFQYHQVCPPLTGLL
jgi:PAB-dependent poly(A)-specific ribonuclease subunit 2